MLFVGLSQLKHLLLVSYLELRLFLLQSQSVCHATGDKCGIAENWTCCNNNPDGAFGMAQLLLPFGCKNAHPQY